MAKSKGCYLPSKATNDYVVQVARLPDLCKCQNRPADGSWLTSWY
jgi:hypothetical protein